MLKFDVVQQLVKSQHDVILYRILAMILGGSLIIPLEMVFHILFRIGFC